MSKKANKAPSTQILCCGSPGQENRHGGGVIWILASTTAQTRFFVQRPNVEITPFSIGCCCTRHAGNPKNMALYMDAALVCGQYDGVVLVGNEDALKKLKTTLSPTVQNRTIAEISRDLTGFSEDDLTQTIRECALI